MKFNVGVLIGWLLIAPGSMADEPIPNQGFPQNVFVITWDGYRWQELFTGADPKLIANADYVDHIEQTRLEFWDDDDNARRKKLTPFIWSEVERNGQIYGNRTKGSRVAVSNPYVFSYPGYSEILVGYVDKGVDSNDRINNPNKTVLEFVNNQPGYQGKVVAFSSWDRFPWIINERRSGVPVNSGFENASGDNLSAVEKTLNITQHQLPKIWESVRYDTFTHQFAKEYIKKNKPRLVYISYGETDDFAHMGKYEYYLKSSRRSDELLKDLWEFTQSDEHYKNNTTFIITTDHGRGSAALDSWMHHGADQPGSEYTWLIAFGAGVKARGEVSNGQPIYAKQIASTVAEILGLNYQSSQPVGAPILQITN